MSLDPTNLARLTALHGIVARVVVASVQGSAPRESGAAVIVWQDGQEGTIGGGALEYQAVAAARTSLSSSGNAPAASPHRLPGSQLASALPDPAAPLADDRALRIPLGPALGQCCGGAVTLLTEFWDAARVNALPPDAYARPLPGSTEAAGAVLPPKVARRLEAIRNGSLAPSPELVQGWMIEPLMRPGQSLWIWGAGHVGRALVEVLSPLPNWQITWLDTAPDRFPAILPPGVHQICGTDLPSLVPSAPKSASHLILTYSHEIDLALCHALLSQGFGFAGLIGSDTKWARFRSRLGQLGHSPAKIDAICCPIGRKTYGKHPQAIAIGVAADLLLAPATPAATKDATG